MVNRFVEHHTLFPDFSEAQAQLLAQVRSYMSSDDAGRANSAFQLAHDATLSSMDVRVPLEHSLAVSTILAQWHIDAIGVAAGLVFEAVDARALTVKQVEQALGPATARVVSSMLRLNILERRKQNVAGTTLESSNASEEPGTGGATPAEKKPRIREALRRQQAETVRKMFIAMAEDPRVVLLKLAYRLNAMRMICQSPDPNVRERQDSLTMAQETREIYAPLAGRLGMSRAEGELQDLAFQILEPEKFQWVRDIVEEESNQWRSYVDRVCEILRREMASIGVKAEVSGRVKHLYSFYRKLERTAGDAETFEAIKQAADVSQIHDLIAFRILVGTTPDCYLALGHVHSLWKPKEGRIKDFIANPKPNGYRALHTTVFCLDEQLVEIQIRTREMHEMAEYGVAMHWYYKDVGDEASASARELLSWLGQMAEWQSEIRSSHANDAEFVEAVKGDIFQEQIFVFTPRGEVKDLPVGSTPLDFAYRIHTKIGDHCAGARIHSYVDVGGDRERLVSRMVPLDYELKNGEIIDIVTNRSAHPTRDWLHFARTAAARSKIRRYLKLNERDINIQIGRERLERELKLVGAGELDDVGEEARRWLREELRMDSLDDILSAVGAGDLRARQVALKIAEYGLSRDGKDGKEQKDEDETIVLPAINPKQAPSARLEVAGVNGLLTRLANCCYPLPGDAIIGFISRGKGVVVHRADCPNIALYREKERERLISVSWPGMSPTHYLVPIVISARDRPGLIRDIATVISDLGLNLSSINTQVNARWETALITATIEVADLSQMHRLFAKLESVKDVIHVERDMGRKK